MPPARARTWRTPPSTAASSVTSMRTHSIPGAEAASRRPAPKTRKPRAARRLAVAAPIPDDAPVTSATRLMDHSSFSWRP